MRISHRTNRQTYPIYNMEVLSKPQASGSGRVDDSNTASKQRPNEATLDICRRCIDDSWRQPCRIIGLHKLTIAMGVSYCMTIS